MIRFQSGSHSLDTNATSGQDLTETIEQNKDLLPSAIENVQSKLINNLSKASLVVDLRST